MNAPMHRVRALGIRSADIADPAEKQRISDFIRAQPEGTPFHLPEWVLAVERGCRQKGHYLVAETADGTLAAVLPLTEIRSRLFGSALVSVGFGVGGGPLGDPAAVDMLALAASTLASRLGCGSVELRGGPVPDGFERRDGIYAGFVRALPKDDDAILKTIPRKQRAEVRRALGHGLKITVGTGEKDRSAHFRVYSESVRNLGTPVFPPALFEAMLDGFGDEADILTVRRDGRPVASVLSFYFNGTVYPFWGGGTREARTLRANEMLYFELMRHAAARGCTRFDFGRSKAGTGAYAYKKNWGFEPQPIEYAVRALQDGAVREINPLSPRYRVQIAAWRKLPLALANRIGPLLSRGLG